MVVQKILVLSLFITQALSAPSGCIESCTYIKQHESQIAGVQDHAELSQGSASSQGLDYSRPGTWSEHNDYNIDNGHGKVHEERGQVVDGSKTVRYYKKNYTSSYSNGHSYGARLLDVEHQNNKHAMHMPNIDEILNSQKADSQVGNLETITQQQKYNKGLRQQHTQSSLRSTNEHSERLEDFGEYSGSSYAIQPGVSDLDTQVSQREYNRWPKNWSKVDSYKTDGGHGHVFEEEGQYTAGAKKIRYFKRNYTSSYSSSDGVPVSDIAKIEVRDMHRGREELNEKLGKEYSQTSTAEHKRFNNVGQTHNVNSNYRDQDSYGSSKHHNGEEHFRKNVNEQLSYINPSPNMRETNSYNTYERHEGRVTKLQSANQLINPTSGYTSVMSTGNTDYHRNMFSGTNSQQEADNVQQGTPLNAHQSKFGQDQLFLDNLKGSAHMQNSAINLGTPEQQSHYEEYQSSHHIKQSSAPQYSTDISYMNQNMNQYSSNEYKSRYNSHKPMQHLDSYIHQFKDGEITSTRNRHLGKLITGAMDVSQGEDTADCAYVSDQTLGNSQYRRKFKRSAVYNELYKMQQTGNLESQQSYQPWNSNPTNQNLHDITQKTDKFDDLTPQISGQLEFGQELQQSYQSWKPNSDNQKLGNLIQQTSEPNDFSEQASGKLELGEESQQSHQPRKPNNDNQKIKELTQQTGELDDLSQQTSGKFEFGQGSQQSYHPWKLTNDNQKLDDLTQQTGEPDDFSEQASGKLELGQESQQSYQPWKLTSDNQKVEELTQQTGELDDVSQQTSGKLEFGQGSQQSYHPWKLTNDNQKLDDLTQQTGEPHDFSEQASGKLEFGQESQQSYQPWKPTGDNQKLDDLTQQTGELDNFAQQTFGKLEFGQGSQQSYEPWKPTSDNQKVEELTQQIGELDNLSQQTSGKIEFGQGSQQSYHPWKLTNDNQKLDDLTQQTGEPDDFSEQASGKLELGQESQQSYQPWKPTSDNQKVEELTQQTGELDDLSQQTSGKLEFGQGSQQSYHPWKLTNDNQKLDDLTEQTGEPDDFSEQASGKLEFGQESQQSYQPWKPTGDNQKLDDFTQQTGELDNFSQQTSGKLEFGQESQQSYQPWKPTSDNQKVENHTQEIGELDDLSQHTAGKLEFGQESQQSYQPWKPTSANQKLDDLTQQISDVADLSQQASGKLEFGQESQLYQPWKPTAGNQKLDDLTQQTGEVDNLSQQTSGKFEFGQESQQSYQPWEPYSGSQKEDLNQQTFGKLEFGQESQQTYQPWKPSNNDKKLNDLFQQTDDVSPQEGLDSYSLKPAGKPKSRSKYLRTASMVNQHLLSQNIHITNNPIGETSNNVNTDAPIIYEFPPQVDVEGNADSIWKQNMRENPDLQSSTNKDISQNLNKQPETVGYDAEGGNVDQVNWLHKSNDATVGLQWHYTYHPSDQRQFVQQTDQKNKEDMEEQVTQDKLSNLHQATDQSKYTLEDSHQQPGSNRQSYNHASEGVKTTRRKFSNLQQQNKLISNQHVTSGNEEGQKNIRSSETMHQLEPRILEAYGGGSYDPSHEDNIYSGVRVNPSAILPPISNVDPWYIREKPKEILTTTEESTSPPSPVEPLDNNANPLKENSDTNETTPTSVWSRISHKITSTIDKAKEKAKVIFG